MKSHTASSRLTANSASPSTSLYQEPTTGTAEGKVIYAEFPGPTMPSVLPGAIDIDDLVAELEQSTDNAQAIAQGRQWVAETFYADRQSVAQLRLSRGWSQAELARRADTSQPYIARLELGKVDPQVSTVKKLAKALGVPTATVVDAISPEGGS